MLSTVIAPVPAAGGGGGSTLKNNFDATVPPTLTDDATAGYTRGSSWMIFGTGEMWRCREPTAGAARWVKVDTADHPGYVGGRYYVPFGAGSSQAGAAMNTTTTYLVFGVIKHRVTLSQLGARLTTIGSGGNVQFAVYEHNQALAQPGKLIANTVSTSTGTVGAVTAAFVGSATPTLEPGNYWFAIQCDNASAIFLATAPANMFHASTVGSATSALSSSSGTTIGLAIAGGTFGTWPADYSGSTFSEQSSTRSYLIQFLVASAP